MLNALFGSMQPVWAQHSESEAISQSLRAISAHRSSAYVESHESDQSTRKTEGSLTPKATLTLRQWSRINCLSKGKAAADVAEVAKHLNITMMSAMPENAGGIAEWQSYNGIYRIKYAECHGRCRSLDELIKSRSVHLNRLAHMD